MVTNSFILNLILKTPVFVYAIILLVVFYEYLYRYRDRELHKKLQQFPSLPRLPIIGSVHLVFGSDIERIQKLLKINQNYEKPLIFWLLHIPLVCLTKPEDILIVSQKSQERRLYGALENILGKRSIVTSEEARWKHTRRIMNPAFTLNMLQKYVSVFNEKERGFIKTWKSKADTDELFDIWDSMIDLHVGVITKNITGAEFEINAEEEALFTEALMKTLKLDTYRIVNPLLYPKFMYNLYLFLTGNKNVFKNFRKLPIKIIEKRKNEYKKLAKNRVIDEQFFKDNPPNSLLDLLLQEYHLNDYFTDQDLLEEVTSIIFTGSESAAVTGSFTLFMLSMHPEIQEKAYREIKSVFQDKEQSLQLEDLNNLPFVEQCIKETLRMFTLLPLTARKTAGNITLSDKRVIPANVTVVLALHAVHIDPELNANPQIWNPDRFSSDSVETKQRNNFVPFGLGPRACIGAKYGMLSLKTMVAHILRNYRLSTTHTLADVQLIMDMLIRNKHGYQIKLHSREN